MPSPCIQFHTYLQFMNRYSVEKKFCSWDRCPKREKIQRQSNGQSWPLCKMMKNDVTFVKRLHCERVTNRPEKQKVTGTNIFLQIRCIYLWIMWFPTVCFLNNTTIDVWRLVSLGRHFYIKRLPVETNYTPGWNLKAFHWVWKIC